MKMLDIITFCQLCSCWISSCTVLLSSYDEI